MFASIAQRRERQEALTLAAVEILGSVALYLGIIAGLIYQIGRAAGYLG